MAAHLLVCDVRPFGADLADIVILAGRIASEPAPNGVPVLDVDGRISLPGLVEAHNRGPFRWGRPLRHLVPRHSDFDRLSMLRTRLGRVVIACSLGAHYQPPGAAGLARILAQMQEGDARKTR